MSFKRGYLTQLGTNYKNQPITSGIGALLKDNLLKNQGGWSVSAGVMGEMIPQKRNIEHLDKQLKDKYGLPQLRIDIKYSENDDLILADFLTTYQEMFDAFGYKNIKAINTERLPGSENHEMGGIRMGTNPNNSMLNKWNALHAVPNVFVSDGSCMTSTAAQNPSLSYMALTARAVNYAVKNIKF
jgi:choline dehydrogenase-like flavoprotein